MIQKTTVLFFLLIIHQSGFSKSWSGKCTASLLQDTNVFESFDKAKQDHLARVWLDGTGRIHPVKPLFLYLNYSGGFDAFAVQTSENRTVHALFGLVEIPLRKKTYLGAELQGKTSVYLKTERNYATWRIAPFLRMQLLDGFQFYLSWTFSAFDYAPGHSFDYRFQNGRLSLESSPLPQVKWSLNVASYVMTYKREALKCLLPSSIEPSWISLGYEQKDRILEYSASFEAFYWAYLLVRFSYENNRSNSFGYSYRDPRIEVIFAKMLPLSLNLKLFWTYRAKSYTDSLAPSLQIRPDAEDETNSQALLDVSRKMNERWTARLRVARYRNESPFRNLYYQKDVASFGCTYEF